MTRESAGFVRIGSSSQLRSASARHHITLRHKYNTNQYHSLLLFSFPKAPGEKHDNAKKSAVRFHCMEAVCPHLGAPLENASIYDVDDEDDIEDAVIVCPWHEYDFSLRTGESSTGLKACVYMVEEREGEVWVEEPRGTEIEHSQEGAQWTVIEVRSVREGALNDREGAIQHLAASLSSAQLEKDDVISISPRGLDIVPKTLVEWAVLVLNTPEPRLKVHYTKEACKAFRAGACKTIGGGRWSQQSDASPSWICSAEEKPPGIPPRLSDAKVVQPGQVARRGKGGSEKSRIAMLHSLANIEQWAIDLAWDIIARAPQLFAERSDARNDRLPIQFFSDFVKVAEDEAKHFTLLQDRLEQMGASFGDLPVHHGLWDSAIETMHSLDARLSIIHLVHEARGLDANPLTIKKFANAGDEQSVEILTVIHLDEVTHVSAGHRWMTYLCDQSEPKQDPITVFRSNVRQHFAGKLKGPFNTEDRTKAGLTKGWYEDLVGEKGGYIGVSRAEVPGG